MICFAQSRTVLHNKHTYASVAASWFLCLFLLPLLCADVAIIVPTVKAPPLLQSPLSAAELQMCMCLSSLILQLPSVHCL